MSRDRNASLSCPRLDFVAHRGRIVGTQPPRAAATDPISAISRIAA